MFLGIAGLRIIAREKEILKTRAVRVGTCLALLTVMHCFQEEIAREEISAIDDFGFISFLHFTRAWIESPNGPITMAVPSVPITILDESE